MIKKSIFIRELRSASFMLSKPNENVIVDESPIKNRVFLVIFEKLPKIEFSIFLNG